MFVLMWGGCNGFNSVGEGAVGGGVPAIDLEPESSFFDQTSYQIFTPEFFDFRALLRRRTSDRSLLKGWGSTELDFYNSGGDDYSEGFFPGLTV